MPKRLLTLLVLAPVVLVLVLAACGGDDSKPSSSANPLVDAAEATAAEGSETTETTITVTYPTAALSIEGEGGYNHATDEGWQELVIRRADATLSMDEIFVKSVLWMKSDELFGPDLPAGKQWLKYDTNRAGLDSGFNFKALFGQSPADMLRQLQRTALPVTTIGEETVDGEQTTHYRATIDPAKTPSADNMQALSKAIYKPVDAWVDEDGRVRQVKLDYTTRIDPAQAMRGRVQLTMKLSNFGANVDVKAPAAGLVVDATENSGQAG